MWELLLLYIFKSVYTALSISAIHLNVLLMTCLLPFFSGCLFSVYSKAWESLKRNIELLTWLNSCCGFIILFLCIIIQTNAIHFFKKYIIFTFKWTLGFTTVKQARSPFHTVLINLFIFIGRDMNWNKQMCINQSHPCTIKPNMLIFFPAHAISHLPKHFPKRLF